MTCKRGFVKRHGKCRKARHHKRKATGGVTGEDAATQSVRQSAHWLSGVGLVIVVVPASAAVTHTTHVTPAPTQPPARRPPTPIRCPGRPTSKSIRPAATSTSPTLATSGSRSSTQRATSSSCSARASTKPPGPTSARRPPAIPARRALPAPRRAASRHLPTSPSTTPASLHGDIYVADTAASLVSKFDSTGHIVSAWGKAGQKDGSDTELTSFLAAGGISSLAVGGPNGTLYVGTPDLLRRRRSNILFVTRRTGAYEGPVDTRLRRPLAEGQSCRQLLLHQREQSLRRPGHDRWSRPLHGAAIYSTTTDRPTTGFALDPSSEELYQAVGTREDFDGKPRAPRRPLRSRVQPPGCRLRTNRHLRRSAARRRRTRWVSRSTAPTHTVYVADSTANDVAVFGDARPIVTVGPPDPTETSVTLNAHIDPAGRGDITSCYFEYGFDKSYGTTLPCVPDPASSNFTAPTDVTATITGLSPGTRDHYRVVVSNSADATTYTPDQTFITTQPPSDRRARLGQPHRHHRRPQRPAQSQRPRHDLSLRVRPDDRLRPIGPGPRRVAQRLQRRPGDRRPPHRSHARMSSTTTRSSRPTRMAPLRHRITPSTSIHPAAPTRTSASRPRPTTCRTAGPMSSSRPATPAAPSSTRAGPTPATRPTPLASPSPASGRRSLAPAGTRSTPSATSTSPPAPTPAG